MDRKVLGTVLLERLQWLQWSPHSQLLDVVWCSAVVVVVVVVVVAVGLMLLKLQYYYIIVVVVL